MKIRRYLGSNMQEAMLKVKMDIGSEAVILNTRKVRQKGLFKIFSKPMIEVLAAVDENNAAHKGADKKTEPAAAIRQANGTKTADYDKISLLENKINNIEIMIKDMVKQSKPAGEKEEAAAGLGEQKKVIDRFYNNLIKNEVDAEVAKQIIQKVGERIASNASFNDIAGSLYAVIGEMLGKPKTIALKQDGAPTVVVFVGPTGVGKTTTIAKIAAEYTLNQGKKVSLVTADTYRIAAVDQLKTYAEIIGVPITVAYSQSELNDAIAFYSDKDIIFIDTPGKSHGDKNQFDELKQLVEACKADEIYLLISATSSIKNIKDVLKNYSFLENCKLIFTKTDEVSVSGVILNTRYLTNKSLSYVTTGQSVPDDIETINIEKVAKNLLGSIN